MGERFHSWPYDRTGQVKNATYELGHAYPLRYQPRGGVHADSNNISGKINGLRFYKFGLPGYISQTEILSRQSMAGGHVLTSSTTLPLSSSLDVCQYVHANRSTCSNSHDRYMPYNYNRVYPSAVTSSSMSGNPLLCSYMQSQQPQAAATPFQTYPPLVPIYQNSNHSALQRTSYLSASTHGSNGIVNSNEPLMILPFSSPTTTTLAPGLIRGEESGDNEEHSLAKVSEASDAVTLQITNLDYSLDECSLRSFLMNQLKPITPVVSLVFEGSSYAKVTVPDLYFAKQVVSNLHRKKIGHKRMLVSYTRDSSLTEINTLRCQVAGLLKDVPYNTLPMYKFRELFQSRFKTSISVLDLYKMQDICTINSDNNEDKFISLKPELVNTLESSPLMEGLQHSVPYCSIHFKREQHKGWAEQEIEPLPNVVMTISEIQKLIYPLLKVHPGDIPVATLLHCIEGELKVSIMANENGVNLEHLVCCVQGIQIQVNNFGIKILDWLDLNKEIQSAAAINGSLKSGSLFGSDRAIGGSYLKNAVADPLFQISREVIELVKMSPKSTMKFNRFIPAYHNHFGKQCRVADYGYTKLIELFEALSSVVQIMGDGENRQITLTHRTQMRRFTSDLLRVLRTQGNTSILLSQLPAVFAQTQNRNFDVTDYGVCDIVDILDGLANSNIVVLSTVDHGKDFLISTPKRKQTSSELEKTSVFAGEMVELLQNALQYTILFQKFVRSYHYHFSYQCRLSDYGFLKLADLMDAIGGLIDMELTSGEDKKIMLSPKVARRVFAEQCEDLIHKVTGIPTHCMKMDQVLMMHKKKYGYQIQPKTLGVSDMALAVEVLPYVELRKKDQTIWIICHNNDIEFRLLCYKACKHIVERNPSQLAFVTDEVKSSGQPSELLESYHKSTFLSEFNSKHKKQLTEPALLAMGHVIEIYNDFGVQCIRLTGLMRLVIVIVRLLEQRLSMYLYEIKNVLNIGLTTTFEYGFPNLYSVIEAHDDIFTVNNGQTQEISEVSLTVSCELRQSFGIKDQHILGSIKLPYSKHRPQESFTHCGDHNLLQNNQPKSKIRATTIKYFNSIIPVCNLKPQGNNYQCYQDNFVVDSSIVSPPTYSFPPSSNSSLGNSFGSALGNGSLCNSFCSKENSMKSPPNNSINSSGDLNASLEEGELTNITASTAIVEDTSDKQSSKLWRRRMRSCYQINRSKLSYYDDGSDQSYNMELSYDPPKPDTPRTEKLPFWIDPIWSERSGQIKHNILNIPDLKTQNEFPKLLSPYTISKNENLKRQLFSFANHDRKIA
ncbi:meiosis regulator and mRNA stability factor 1 [Drosophila takahashii]|uniref:meiosis regulator and mRNA stability factor 1 n=1 Tax=Drosophila takahashii TaxID=29030 RepID=UPI0038993912